MDCSCTCAEYLVVVWCGSDLATFQELCVDKAFVRNNRIRWQSKVLRRNENENNNEKMVNSMK